MLPRIVYNKKIKPYWSENLNRLKKISRQKFKKWVYLKDVQEECNMRVMQTTKELNLHTEEKTETRQELKSKNLMR